MWRRQEDREEEQPGLEGGGQQGAPWEEEEFVGENAEPGLVWEGNADQTVKLGKEERKSSKLWAVWVGNFH